MPDEADSQDIRKFFKKIEIPDGGVRILGGEKGIVYITLESENGKNWCVHLFLVPMVSRYICVVLTTIIKTLNEHWTAMEKS